MFWNSKKRKRTAQRISELEIEEGQSHKIKESLWNSDGEMKIGDDIRFKFSHGHVRIYSGAEILTSNISRRNSERLHVALSMLHSGTIRADSDR